VLEVISRRLELQRGNSVGRTEFWSEEPAYCYVLVRQSGDVTDHLCRWPASRPVESRPGQCHRYSRKTGVIRSFLLALMTRCSWRMTAT